VGLGKTNQEFMKIGGKIWIRVSDPVNLTHFMHHTDLDLELEAQENHSHCILCT